MAPIPLLIVLGVAVAGIVISQRTLAVETPDLDFGTGSMFDVIAKRYDMINRILAFRLDVGWRRVMVQKLKDHLDLDNNSSDLTILDVATGTADVALMISKMIPRATTIVGIDPSRGMLDVGRRKITKQHLDDKITLQWADARDLRSVLQEEEEEDSFTYHNANFFDGATMGFGIRNIPERDVALCQIHRVLKPNSPFLILEFSQPTDSRQNKNNNDSVVWGSIASFFIGTVVPYVGGILSGQPKAYKHLQNSIQNFPSPQDFKNLVEGLHCDNHNDNDNEPSLSASFIVDEIVHLNRKTVQLYVLKTVKKETKKKDSHSSDSDTASSESERTSEMA